jgi:hypothetical protein
MEPPELPRWLRLGSKGRDVLALGRALRRAGFGDRSKPAGRVFDAELEAAVRAFQTANGLEIDGVLGPDTYAALGSFYDSRGRWLVSQVPKVAPFNPAAPVVDAGGIRQRIVAAAHLGVENRAAIHYTQDQRRMEGVRLQVVPPRVPSWEDCSSFATWCYWAAGAPDPNGLGYNGFGYTGTQILQGSETADPRPGDLCFYGPTRSNITHVTVYVGNGCVVSHGREEGPELYGSANYRRAQDLQQIRSYLP